MLKLLRSASILMRFAELCIDVVPNCCVLHRFCHYPKCTVPVAQGGSAKAEFPKEGAISGLLEIPPGLIRPGGMQVNRWLGLWL